MVGSGDKGDTLAEALEKSSGPRGWDRYMTIERGCMEIGVIPKLFSPVPIISSDHEDWHYWEKLSMVRKQLSQKLIKRLQTGEWTTTGILSPVSATSKRILIAPHFWGVLEPDFENSSARCGNLLYLDVQVFQLTPRSAGLPDQRALAPAPPAGAPKAKSRSRDLGQEAEIKSRIQQVHAAAQRLCAEKGRAIEFEPLAEALKGTGNYKARTIRQILNGTYKPAKIRGFGPFEWKRPKR
jgi:hypothetical protein